MKGLHTLGTALFLFLACAPAASAQGLEPPSVALSAGAGMAFPLHGDFDFNAPEWQLAIRAAVSPHLVLEGFFDQWRHTDEEVRLGITLLGPDGVIGHAGRLEQRTEFTTRTVGFNALARGSLDRARFTGGGGIGYLTFHRRFTATVSDCESSVPTACQDTENTFSNGAFSVQGVAGVDVFVTSRVAAFGQFQSVIPIDDPSVTHLSVSGGVRLRIW